MLTPQAPTVGPAETPAFDLSDLATATGFGLAVSGGPDSMALLGLFCRWRTQAADSRPVCVLTVDHGLRPEAIDECQMVAETARSLGLESRILRWRPGTGAGMSQTAAREGRYRLIVQAMARLGLSHLLLAHHADDQAETVLMRLFNGSGIDGLSGMSRLGLREGAVLVRPLLPCSKSALREWVRAANLSFVDDPSNVDVRHERSRIRSLMPAVAEAGGDRPTILRLADRAVRARDALETVVAEVFTKAVEQDPFGVCTLDLEAVIPLHREFRIRILRRLMTAVCGIIERRLERLERAEAKLFAGGDSVLTLSGCRLERFKNRLIGVREARNLPRLPRDLEPGSVFLWDRRYRIAADAGAEADLRVSPLGEAGWAEAKTVFESLPGVSPIARASLPAIRRHGVIVAIPGLDGGILEDIGVTFDLIAGTDPANPLPVEADEASP